MKKEEIISVFRDNDLSIYDVAFGEMTNPMPVLGKWVEVDQYGGEGQGDTWWVVYHLIDLDIYIKINGYYNSYGGDGVSLDEFESDLSIVQPRQKTVIFYE